MTLSPIVPVAPAAGDQTLRFPLDTADLLSVETLLDDAVARWSSVEDPSLQAQAPVLAHELPRSLRSFLIDFKLQEPAPYCVLSGFSIDDRRLGDTPPHWKGQSEVSPALREEILLVLLGCLLGEPISWSTQQDGRLVHDVIPIRADENEQLGSGSQQTLLWHTEDAFHPFRGDYLALFCLRNPDRVATTVGSTEAVELSGTQREILFDTRFTIRPDGSHQPAMTSEERRDAETTRSSYAEIERMNRRPDKVAVLSGDPHTPYVRLDPYFMDEPAGDSAATEALDTLVRGIDGSLGAVTLEPGEVLVVDNYRAVHGRKAFKARYDGRDRWLKRINVACDLRKSRASRRSPADRTIF